MVDNLYLLWYHLVMKRFLLIAVVPLLVATGLAVSAYISQSPSAFSGAAYTPDVVHVEEPMVTRDELLQAVNAERAKVGVAPLVLDETLNQTAQAKVDDMLKFNYNGHVNPNTGKRGIEYPQKAMVGRCNSVSENIIVANDQLSTLTAKEAITSWFLSKPHREAMLDPKYTLTGFGVTKPKVVQHFCEPL